MHGELLAMLLCRAGLRYWLGSPWRIMADAAAGAENPEPSVRFRRRQGHLWPEDGKLAATLEGDSKIREAFRANSSKLVAWPSRDLIGVASLKALALNVDVVGKAIEVWSESCDHPRTMSIDWLKLEARFKFTHACRFYISI